ncbi:MAG: 23S rRNA (adenine(2503)-C(2))-methyltransferase RlmN [Chlamydiota bacterium]
MKINLKGMTRPELERHLASMGEDAYRGRQIAEWLYRHGASTFAEMTTLSKGLRARLDAEARIGNLASVSETASAGGDALKYLFRLEDGEAIETVLVRLARGRSVCLSTQVGCPVGCAFCATGALGFRRNLDAGEIVDQFLKVRAALPEGERPTHVVFMGMGEPLLNLDGVEKAILILASPEGPALGPRRITVSTCGIVPGIRRLAAAGLRTELAVSLIAADESVRKSLFPLAGEYPLEDVVRAAGDYAAGIGRPVTFEYLLLRGVNDSRADAQRLGRLIRGVSCKVNLILYNPARGRRFEASDESPTPPPRREALSPPPDSLTPTPRRAAFRPPSGSGGAQAARFEPSDESRASEFRKWLGPSCIAVTVRRSKGAGIDAACGQLRAGYDSTVSGTGYDSTRTAPSLSE